MAKTRSKDLSQLRRKIPTFQVSDKDFYGSREEREALALLPSFFSSSDKSKRRHSDMLRRSRRKERHWKYKQHDIGGGVEADGMD